MSLTRFPFPQQGNNLEKILVRYRLSDSSVSGNEIRFPQNTAFPWFERGLNHFGCFSRPFFIIDEWNRYQVTRLNPWNSVDRLVIGFSHIFQETVYDSDDKFR